MYQIWYILDPYTYLENPLSKIEWKKLIKKHVHSYWREKIQEDCLTFSTLIFLNPKYNIGRIHPLLKSYSTNMQYVSRIHIRLKIVTGTYILQTHRAKYSNGTAVSTLCTVCHKAENLQHFVLSCDALQTIRAPLLHKIITEGRRVFDKDQIAQSIDLLQLIINPFAYILSKTEN